MQQQSSKNTPKPALILEADPFDPKTIRGIISDYDGTIVKAWTTEILPGVKEVLDAMCLSGLKFEVATNQAGVIWHEISKGWAPSKTGKVYDFPSVEKLVSNFQMVVDALDAPWLQFSIAIGDPKALDNYRKKYMGDIESGTVFEPNYAAVDYHKEYETLTSQVAAHLKAEFSMQRNVLPPTISTDHSYRKPEPGMMFQIAQRWNIPAASILCIGDREEDQEAAHRAGMPFTQSWDDVWKVINAQK